MHQQRWANQFARRTQRDVPMLFLARSALRSRAAAAPVHHADIAQARTHGTPQPTSRTRCPAVIVSALLVGSPPAAPEGCR